TRAYLRAFAQTQSDIGQILVLANRVLTEDMTDGHNVTLILVQLDVLSRSLWHTSAGHPPGYVLNATGDVRARLYSTGLPLGIEPDGDFAPAGAVGLEPGGVVLLFTDGLVEARSPADEMFGSDRALDVVRANQGRTAREIVEILHRAVLAFTQDRP